MNDGENVNDDDDDDIISLLACCKINLVFEHLLSLFKTISNFGNSFSYI